MVLVNTYKYAYNYIHAYLYITRPRKVYNSKDLTYVNCKVTPKGLNGHLI